MKTATPTLTKQAGNALLVTLFLCSILGIMMAGYLMFARQQNLLSARSQAWNTSITVVEAGIEEALQHLNQNHDDLTTDGWYHYVSTYHDLYYRFRSLPTGDSYFVYIDTHNSASPEIVCSATVYSPNFAMLSSGPLFADATTTTYSPTITRAVRVTTGRRGLFINALTAKKQIDLNGNNIRTDSFDSSSPAYSESGYYPFSDPSKTRDNGSVASNDTIENAVNVGNANIYGRVATGPSGTVYVGPNGRVGPKGWTPTGSNKIYPGWFTDDMNFTFPDPTPPAGSVLTPSGGYVTNYEYGVSNMTSTTYPSPAPTGPVTTTVNSVTTATYPTPAPTGTVTTNTVIAFESSLTYPAAGTYQGDVATNVVTKGPPSGRGTWYEYYRITGYSYTYDQTSYTYDIPVTNIVDVQYYDYILDDLASGYYELSSLSSSDKVLVRGDAPLNVTGSVDIGSQTLAFGANGTLNLYVHSNFSLAGNETANRPGYAKDFVVWADSGCTSISFSGNAGFTGILYAPYVNLALNGGGNDTIDFIGAAVVNSARLNGHFSFHYDEDLQNMNGGRFIIKSWDEI